MKHNHHEDAAKHYTEAAKHHTEAHKRHQEGKDEKAVQQGNAAEEHSQKGAESAKQAVKKNTEKNSSK